MILRAAEVTTPWHFKKVGSEQTLLWPHAMHGSSACCMCPRRLWLLQLEEGLLSMGVRDVEEGLDHLPS